MYFVDRSAVVLKPTQNFLDWLKSTDQDVPDLTIEQLRANCSVFLVPEFFKLKLLRGIFLKINGQKT